MLPFIVVTVYIAILAVLSLYGLHRYWILYLYWRHCMRTPPPPPPPPPREWPKITIQLPLYNECYVVERLIDAVCRMDYPQDRLHIQLLDDSTDETQLLAQNKVREKRFLGYDIDYVHRKDRRGFKAGALANGLQSARGEFIAIFDADFLPLPDFLRKTVPRFADAGVGMVQARWGHINEQYSLLTKLQSLYLDGHFLLEHAARNGSGAFFNFNGTAGIWRRKAIEEAGGWTDDTLTEDLDISYRAQLKGWKFVFLPDVVCPAELPVDIGAFRSQQHRWMKGALQVAKKILPSVWRSPLPFFVKMESTVHLTANIGYPLMLMLSILLLPSLVARRYLGWPAVVNWIELAAFLLTCVSLSLFYLVAQKENRTRVYRMSPRDIPALMAFGAGMCLNNSRAVWEALFDIRTDFHRTAKFNIQNRGEPWRNKRYRSSGRSLGLAETAIAGYFFLTLYWSLATSNWWALPFIGVFLFGYFYVGLLTLTHRFQKI
ncbi:MAG: glycosyltransferase [Elusimicrobia bacterium]|nr:glycosyltransferase [Elusimicrobiota bacterium]